MALQTAVHDVLISVDQSGIDLIDQLLVDTGHQGSGSHNLCLSVCTLYVRTQDRVHQILYTFMWKTAADLSSVSIIGDNKFELRKLDKFSTLFGYLRVEIVRPLHLALLLLHYT